MLLKRNLIFKICNYIDFLYLERFLQNRIKEIIISNINMVNINMVNINMVNINMVNINIKSALITGSEGVSVAAHI
jgi:hypothetical protein